MPPSQRFGPTRVMVNLFRYTCSFSTGTPRRQYPDIWRPGSGKCEDDRGETARLMFRRGRDQGKQGVEPGKLDPGEATIDPELPLTG